MAKGWVKRWGARGKGHRPSHIPAIEVQPTSISNAEWVLPPSKSHLIRMMYLCLLLLPVDINLYVFGLFLDLVLKR